MESVVPQSPSPHIWCSVATRGWWLPGETVGGGDPAPFCPRPWAQLWSRLSPPPPASALISPNSELVSRAQHFAWRRGWQVLRPKAAKGRPSHSLQRLDGAAAGQATRAQGVGVTGRPSCLPPGKASPAGVKLIRRACGGRVRPPSPRMSSTPPARRSPGLASLTSASSSPHQPTPPHMALASMAK